MKDIEEHTKELMAFDPINAVEKLSGLGHHSNFGELENRLALGLQIEKSRTLEGLLILQDDTTFSMKMNDYLRIAKDEGFEEIYRLDFESSKWFTEDEDKKPMKETFICLWHPLNILMVCDSFYGSRNAAKIYYSCKSSNDIYKFATSGGGSWSPQGDENVHISWDARTGLRLYMKNFREHVKEAFNLWENDPFIWLLHHEDTKTEGYNYKAINKERASHFPEHVRKVMGY